MKIGIDAISYYVPNHYLPIEALAKARNIEYAKLNKGLGLTSMSFPDVDEDAASMGANAVLDLFQRESLNPSDVGRIYLGTESALDSAKPTATYILDLVEKELSTEFGPRSLKNTDAVDMTFACIGAVDALENACLYLKQNPGKKAIIVASDLAKYNLGSTGEYTQGAGAVALLISKDPAIISLGSEIGVATKGERDFFKPRRTQTKSSVLVQAAHLLGINLNEEEAKTKLLDAKGFWGGNTMIRTYLEEPVFDGQYSNSAYIARIKEALEDFQSKISLNPALDWGRVVMHLPYAFQGRRMLVNFYLDWMQTNGRWNEVVEAVGSEKPENKEESKNWVRTFSKSDYYKAYVDKALAPAERASGLIGNMYTASIFMGLLSTLCDAAEKGDNIEGVCIGFMGYGSGSKAKVFQGYVQKGWSKVAQLNLFERLNQRTAVDFNTYENWHNERLSLPILPKKNVFVLEGLRTEENQEFFRDYKRQ
ncbi:MAG: hydroxymethylglutaryl-CoA synthase [Flavobacteriales bacterium]|nr:hydroxymethylglutaryl-CoA synthase [Flavobacteriales bacterium]|tara:strand:+ start:10823 stop:12262 length:1440 start_codon:yes stop_codon:yes gene_type:complete